MSTFLESSKRPAVKVFVATTVMLTFISFWRAAAIVLSDLASSAYYAGGDAEKVIGKSAPWFILAGFIEDIGRYLHHPFVLNENYFAAAFAVVVVMYFWWKNIQGIHESSEK